jgi:hypothetical protein
MADMLVLAVVVSAIATLLLLINTASAQSEDLETHEVRYAGESFQVRAAMPGEGTIDAIQVFPEYGSIYITLDVDSEEGDGELQIILPRSLIDSKTEDGADTDFLILVDGEDVNYSETASSPDSRELRIPILADSTEIEIFGSQILPEFPIGILPLITSSAIIFAILYQRFNLSAIKSALSK